MMNSPWAMLMTPIWPNVKVRPSATSSRIEPRLRPLKSCSRKVSTQCPVRRAAAGRRPEAGGRRPVPRRPAIARRTAATPGRTRRSTGPRPSRSLARHGSGSIGSSELQTSSIRPSALMTPMRAVLETCWFQSLDRERGPRACRARGPWPPPDRLDVERPGLLDGRRPDVDGVVAGLDGVGRHPVVAVLVLEGRDERLVLGRCRWSGSSSRPRGGPRCSRRRCRRPPPRPPTPRWSGSSRRCCPWR